MIEEIRIRSLGVIDTSVLQLGPGLTVITGETGAGKTMVVTALGLLLGGRADSGAVRVGARQARVEGLVRADDDLRTAVEEAGGEVEDGHVVLARNVQAEGRSRAFVGGAAVPITTLGVLTEPLVAVHGQADQHRLLKPAVQRDALDRFAGADVVDAVAAFAALHRELVDLETELAEVIATSRERARRADLLRFGIGEIESVAPQPGEETELAQEESRLGHADTLLTAAAQAREALSSEHDAPDALTALAAARGVLDGVREHDEEAARLADRLAELTYLLSDLAADVASYGSGIEADPARLAAVSERRAALTALCRKYGDNSSDVLAWADDAARQLLELDATDDRINQLTERRIALRADLTERAGALSRERRRAAERLAAAVTEELRLLAMPDAEVDVAVTQRDAPAPEDEALAGPDSLLVDGGWVRSGNSGVDEVEFRLAANSGIEARPLHKGASGGELSRVMLAVEVCLATTFPVPTFVFDEVDSGVGGTAAVEIGRRLAELARHSQVLVVTHLPQVAAYADHHVVVRKESDGTVTTSGLAALDDAGRERELSRMLAGLTDSETALAHARELLEVAHPDRASAQ